MISATQTITGSTPYAAYRILATVNVALGRRPASPPLPRVSEALKLHRPFLAAFSGLISQHSRVNAHFLITTSSFVVRAQACVLTTTLHGC